MKYLFHNFINTLRHYKASSLLNIFGMAVAFAAFYVILTQVQWGFTYNKGIEDGERIFLMTRPNPGKDGDLNCTSQGLWPRRFVRQFLVWKLSEHLLLPQGRMSQYFISRRETMSESSLQWSRGQPKVYSRCLTLRLNLDRSMICPA